MGGSLRMDMIFILFLLIFFSFKVEKRLSDTPFKVPGIGLGGSRSSLGISFFILYGLPPLLFISFPTVILNLDSMIPQKPAGLSRHSLYKMYLVFCR